MQVQVTGKHLDVGEARDTLERIHAIDRADTPAVAQRRQLAASDRQPARTTPRCGIPEWFSAHRAAAYERYRTLIAPYYVLERSQSGGDVMGMARDIVSFPARISGGDG